MKMLVKSFLVVLMTWLVVDMTSQVQGGAIYYNEARLNLYSRLTQQLRGHFKKLTDALTTRLVDFDNAGKTAAVVSNITADLANAMSLVISFWKRLDTLQNSLGLNLAPFLNLVATNPYVDVNTLMFTGVKLDHGFNYDPQTGTAIITKTGVYFMELKIQSNDNADLVVRFDVRNTAGELKYLIMHNIDWEVTPFFEVLFLEAGDQFQTYSLVGASTSNHIGSFRRGFATQVNLQYLGQAQESESWQATVPPNVA